MLVKIDNIISNNEIVIAHTKLNTIETLKEHSDKTLDAFHTLNKHKNILLSLEKILDKIEIIDKKCKGIKLTNANKDFIKELFINAIYMHDFGKCNPKMQIDKFNNTDVASIYKGNIAELESYHSPLSAAIYIDYFRDKLSLLGKGIEQAFLGILLYAFSYVIYTHHGDLDDFEEWVDDYKEKISVLAKIKGYSAFLNKSLKLDSQPLNYMRYIKDGKINYNGYLVFILIKLLQSSIIASDYIATSNFYNSEAIEINTLDNIDEVINTYRDTDIYRGVMDYKNNPKINILPINKERNEMFLEAEESLENSLDSLIYFLVMPTGAGKTFASINLSLNLIKNLDLNNLIYVFPFNTLVDQTNDVFKDVFKDELHIELINSISPITAKENSYGSIDYNVTLLDRQLWNYPAKITSHVSLFEILFSGRREASMPFLQLINSVIVLDEIQCYKNSIYREIIEFLYTINDVFGSRMIIMSATNPPLYNLSNFTRNTKNLIKDTEKCFLSPVFKNRVEMDKSLMADSLDFKKLITKIDKDIRERNELLKKDTSYKGNVCTKTIVEFIKKKTAQLFYEEIALELRSGDYTIYELDGDTPKYERDKILKEIKENDKDNIILITTQLIEAGVDIDMDLGYKDISLFDSEEQLMGRVNRSCKKPYCRVFFFDLDKEDDIYKNDNRLNLSIKEDKYWDYLENKEFDKFYEELFKYIASRNNRLNETGINAYYDDLKLLKIKKVETKMKLIESKTFQVYIPSVINVYNEDTKAMEIIDGYKMWSEYLDLINGNLLYAERRVKLRALSERMNYFTFSVHGIGIDGIEAVNGLTYVDDPLILRGGKINRDELKNRYKILPGM